MSKELIQKSFLQSGKDLPITTSLSFKHPTVQEILELDTEHNGLYSENLYYSMINIFLTDPYLYMVYLDDKKMDYEKVKPFELFIMLFQDYISKISGLSQAYPQEQINEIFKNNVYFKAFDFFLGVDAFFVAKDEDGNEVLGYGDNQLLMDATIFDYIYEFVRGINGIQDGDRINPSDEFAKQVLIDDEREKLAKQAKKIKDDDEDANNNRLGNLLSSVTWACSGGVTPFNRKDLHMYDLVEGVQRTDKLLNYKNTMVGLYSGCVDKKGIDFNKLHWST